MTRTKKNNKKNMKVSEKYRHIGYSYPGVPNGWKPIVEKAIIEIEREMWPRWIPVFIKRWIHYLATGNSVVRVRSWFWYRVREKLTKGQIITDIKDKFATLRIYGSFGDEIEKIIDKAEEDCYRTCERCGGNEKVRSVGKGWIYNLCKPCRKSK
jgi:hypothetical protein